MKKVIFLFFLFFSIAPLYSHFKHEGKYIEAKCFEEDFSQDELIEWVGLDIANSIIKEVMEV